MQWQTLPNLSDYEATLAAMQARVEAIIRGEAEEAVWLLEHPPLYTAGTSANTADLLDAARFPVYAAGRGGEYTYHGPGQRVVYAMLNLQARAAQRSQQPDLRAYVQQLEQWIILTLAHFGVVGELREGRIGVWVQTPTGEAKIAALGIRIRRWVSFHGLAINLNPNLEHFSGIVPCGIANYGVTSLHALGVKASMAELDVALKDCWNQVFEMR